MNAGKIMAALLVVFLLVAGTTLAAEKGTVLKADKLKAEPFRDAKTVGSLTAGQKVDILDKQGGWFRVISAKHRGWVRMLSIRRGEARKGSGEIAGVLGLASGRAGTGSVIATTGIRGLNEEGLKAAKYDEAELKKMESFAATDTEVRRFISEGKLVTRKVEYLSAPSAAKGGR